MRPIAMLLLALLLSTPCTAQDLFFDDFSADLGQWTISDQFWSIREGWLRVDLPQRGYISKAFVGSATWSDYVVDFDLTRYSNTSALCYIRYQNESTGYFVNFRGPVPDENNDPGAVRIFKLNDQNSWPWGSWELVAYQTFPNLNLEHHHLSIQALGATITVSVDDVDMLSWTDNDNPVLTGQIGLAGFMGATPGPSQVEWDNVRVQSLPLPTVVAHLDINPGSCPNPLSLNKRGVIPAALLGSPDFDVSNVNVSSLRLEGVAPKRTVLEDILTVIGGAECLCTAEQPDGWLDLNLKFSAVDVITAILPAWDKESRVLRISGSMNDGSPFEGSDWVVIRGGIKEQIADLPAFQGDEGEAEPPHPFEVWTPSLPEGSIQRFGFSLEQATEIKLNVYDVSGRLVEHLVQDFANPGVHEATWNTVGVPNGMYFYRLSAGSQAVTGRVLIIQ